MPHYALGKSFSGDAKARLGLDKQLTLGLLAAFYIGFSCTTMMVVGGQVWPGHRGVLPLCPSFRSVRMAQREALWLCYTGSELTCS
jgi:hypothetical protein